MSIEALTTDVNINPMSIEGRFAYFAECNLATLEMLKAKKSSAQSEISRQQSICDGMVDVLRMTKGMAAYLSNDRRNPRLHEIFSEKARG